MSASFYQWQGNNLLLTLKVQPKARRDAFGEVLDDAIKLAVTAPPVDGKANNYIVKLLAKWFGIPQRQVMLLKGQTSRRKIVQIEQPTKIPAALESLGTALP